MPTAFNALIAEPSLSSDRAQGGMGPKVEILPLDLNT